MKVAVDQITGVEAPPPGTTSASPSRLNVTVTSEALRKSRRRRDQRHRFHRRRSHRPRGQIPRRSRLGKSRAHPHNPRPRNRRPPQRPGPVPLFAPARRQHRPRSRRPRRQSHHGCGAACLSHGGSRIIRGSGQATGGHRSRNRRIRSAEKSRAKLTAVCARFIRKNHRHSTYIRPGRFIIASAAMLAATFLNS